MIKVVCWNIDGQIKPWDCLAEMSKNGEADVALLQEAGPVSGGLKGKLEVDDAMFAARMGFKTLPLIVKLSGKVTVKPYKQVPVVAALPEDAIGVSDIGTVAAARVAPVDAPKKGFLAVSMYARWLETAPGVAGKGIASVNSAHRIISDLAAFIGFTKRPSHRILAAGDLNMFYGAVGTEVSVPWLESTVWFRMRTLDLRFMGPQQPECKPLAPGVVQVDVPPDTKNVPTFRKKDQKPEDADRQLDYVFASEGFHKEVSVRALNGPDEWGPSDHCRVMITVS